MSTDATSRKHTLQMMIIEYQERCRTLHHEMVCLKAQFEDARRTWKDLQYYYDLENSSDELNDTTS